MKIIHCADLHLDSRMSVNLSPEKARERRAELLITFENMVEYAVREQVKHIIIAGDLYDRKNISAAARKTIVSAIRNHPDIYFYYLKGNHDADAVISSFDELPENLFLFRDTWTTCRIGDSCVRITGAELNPENSQTIFDALTLDPAAFNIVTLHGQITDTGSADGKSAARGSSTLIPLRALQNKGIDYLALGHLHAPGRGRLDRRGEWCYAGCLEGRGFDECGEHGFMLLDIDEARHTMEVTFVPIAKRTLHEVRIDVSGCRDSYEAFSAMQRTLKAGNYPAGDMVRAVLTGEIDLSCSLDMTYLNKHLEDSFYFAGVENETVIKPDYRAFEKEMSPRGEFVRLVRNNPDYTEEEKAGIIQHGIRLMMGEIEYEDKTDPY